MQSKYWKILVLILALIITSMGLYNTPQTQASNTPQVPLTVNVDNGGLIPNQATSSQLSLVALSPSATKPFEVAVMVDNAVDLGAFEFNFNYPSDLVEVTNITIASAWAEHTNCEAATTRCAVHLGPLDAGTTASGLNSLLVGAATYGNGDGLNGEQTLAIFEVTPLKYLHSATFSLNNINLSDVAVADPISPSAAKLTVELYTVYLPLVLKGDLTHLVTTDSSDSPASAYSATELAQATSTLNPFCAYGDVNFDDMVNVIDVQLVANAWQATPTIPGWLDSFDFNDDGLIDETDISYVAGRWYQNDLACIPLKITSPISLDVLNTPLVTVTGNITQISSGATLEVWVSDVPATVTANSFEAVISLKEGDNHITALAIDSDGNRGGTEIAVNLDTAKPRVTIDIPQDALVTDNPTIDVSGNVNDVVIGTINKPQVHITVNGIEAEVVNRRFLAKDVPLKLGKNIIAAVGTDNADNMGGDSIEVTYQNNLNQPRIEIVSGNQQSNQIGLPLANPLVAVVKDANGNPMVGQTVVFKVTKNNGSLSDGTISGRTLVLTTDNQGQAQAFLTLGTRSGVASDLVEARAIFEAGQGVKQVTFINTAIQGPAGLIQIDSGSNQTGATNQALPNPLVVVVTDESNNRLIDVPVTFKVVQGGGSFNGETTFVAMTDSDGRAKAILTLGKNEGYGNNRVEATYPNSLNMPAVFVASGKIAGNPADTKVSGVVMDNSNIPLSGVTMEVHAPNNLVLTTTTDAQGQFLIESAPVAHIHLVADGRTADREGTWPRLEYELHTIAGHNNTIGMPVYLLQLDAYPDNQLCVTDTAGGELKLDHLPGFALKIEPGAATFLDGTKTGCVGVTAVHADKVPMPPRAGQQPRLPVTIQPPGVHFDPPAQLTMPNVDGLEIGTNTEFFSFDHDLGEFVSIGTATVSEDGLTVTTNPGSGVIKAGWHYPPPPPPPPPPIFPVKINDFSCYRDASQPPAVYVITPTVEPLEDPDITCEYIWSGTIGNVQVGQPSRYEMSPNPASAYPAVITLTYTCQTVMTPTFQATDTKQTIVTRNNNGSQCYTSGAITPTQKIASLPDLANSASKLQSQPTTLNENCVVSIFNQTVNVRPDGYWKFYNVPASLGLGRIRATCVENGITRSGQTDFFPVLPNIPQLLDYRIPMDGLEQVPESLTITGTLVLTEPGASGQLITLAHYPNGTEDDVTTNNKGTIYASSNEAILTVNPNGQLIAHNSGSAAVSAINEGALGLTVIEIQAGNNPSVDTDGDGIPNSIEGPHPLLNPNDAEDGFADWDEDGLTNYQEIMIYATFLDDADSDDDLLLDGFEVLNGTNPLDPNDPADYSQVLQSISVLPTSFQLTTSPVITETSVQLNVTGTLSDGTTIDLTNISNYASSDLTVCNFGATLGQVFAGQDGTCVITVTNSGFSIPVNGVVESLTPAPVSFIDLSGIGSTYYIPSIDIKGDYAYVSVGSSGLEVIDVSNRANPVSKATLNTTGYAYDVRIVGNLAYVAADSGGLKIIDISDPTNPTILGTAILPGNARDVMVQGNRAYVAALNDGMHIVDISNPANPTLIATANTSGNTQGVAVSEDGLVAVVANGHLGIQTINLNNETNPTIMANFNTCDINGTCDTRDIIINDNILFVADRLTSLNTFDISNPANPVHLDNIPVTTGGRLADLALRNDLIVGADVTFVNAVPIFYVANPNNILFSFFLDFSVGWSSGAPHDYNGSGIAIDDEYIYLASNRSTSSRLYIGQYANASPPSIAVTPTTLDFGQVGLGLNKTLTVEVSNQGVSLLNIDNITINGTGFSLLDTTPFSLTLGSTKILTVEFAPTTIGLSTGNITLNSNDPAQPTFNLSLQGEGVEASMGVAPQPLVFNATPVGSSQTLTLTLSNIGTEAFDVTDITSSGLPFSVLNAGPFSLNPSQSQGVGIAFSPTTGGLINGNIVISTTIVNQPTVTVNVSGTGLSPNITTNAIDLNFGTVWVGNTNTLTTSIGNTGDSILNVYTISTTLNDFSISNTGNFTLAVNQFVPLAVTFGPNSGGLITDALLINSNDLNQPALTIALSGTGFLEPDISVTPLILNFGSVNVGSSYTLPITISNNGNVDLNITAITPSNGQFSVSNPGGFTIPAANSSTVNVSFSPLSNGVVNATLNIASNDPDQPTVLVDLQGEGAAPIIEVSPLNLNFGQVLVGNVQTQTLAITNSGTVTLAVNTISSNNGAFTASSGGGFNILPSQSILISVFYSPIAVGVDNGNLSIVSNDPAQATVNVSLQGEGVEPNITVTPLTLNFGSVYTFSSHTLPITISNNGTADLTIGAINSTHADFNANSTGNFSLNPGQSQVVDVTFSPSISGTINGNLQINSDDPDQPMTVVALTGDGFGLNPPEITISPPNFNLVMMMGNTSNVTLAITNTGMANLNYSLFISPTIAQTPRTLNNTVLIIADGGTEITLTNILTQAGYTVDIVADDSLYDGSNPAPDTYDAVVLLDGINFGSEMPVSGQTALVNYVKQGGGFISMEWIRFEQYNYGIYTELAPLTPLANSNSFDGTDAYTTTLSHQLTQGVNPTFSVTAGTNVGVGSAATVLVTGYQAGDAMIAKHVGTGRIVEFSVAGSYNFYDPFSQADMAQLFLNAVSWTSEAGGWLDVSSSSGTVVGGMGITITVSVSATSLLPEVYTASLVINSNDPATPQVTVPITLTATSALRGETTHTPPGLNKPRVIPAQILEYERRRMLNLVK